MNGVDSDDPIDERITRVLSEDPLARIRALYYPTVSEVAPATKLRIIGGIAAVAALVPLALASVRGEALRATLGVRPALSASVAGGLILASGLQFVTLGGALLWLATVVKDAGEMTENRALRVVGMEDVGLFLGVAPGGTLTALGLLGFVWLAVGPAAPDELAGVVSLAAVGRPVPTPLSYTVLVGWAAVVAVAAGLGSLTVGAE